MQGDVLAFAVCPEAQTERKRSVGQLFGFDSACGGPCHYARSRVEDLTYSVHRDLTSRSGRGGVCAPAPATFCLSRTSYLCVGDQLNVAAPSRRRLAARPSGGGWAASSVGGAREVSAYPREVEAQAATVAAEASPAELVGMGVDPIPVDAELPRDLRCIREPRCRRGHLLAEQLGKAGCDRLYVLAVESHPLALGADCRRAGRS